MKQWIHIIRSNPGLSLLTGNVVLLVVLLLLTYNPFGVGSYAKARRLLDIERNEIRSISIQYADGTAVSLDRTDETWPVRKEPGSDLPGAPKTKAEPEYKWKMQARSEKNTLSFVADRERLRDLLTATDGLRRYYGLPASDENRKRFEIDDRSTVLLVSDGHGKEQKIRLGLTAARSDSSYVLAEGDSSIYQVESNLKPRVGTGDVSFFRDRSVFPPDLNSDSVASIALLFPGRTVRIAKTGSEWQMIEPVPGKMREEAFRPLLDDLMAWKARSFPARLPDGVKRQQGRIEITYHRGSTDPGVVQVDIEASKDYGSYFVRIDKNLYEISSYYFEDLKEPEKLLDRPARGR